MFAVCAFFLLPSFLFPDFITFLIHITPLQSSLNREEFEERAARASFCLRGCSGGFLKDKAEASAPALSGHEAKGSTLGF
jgi:hypothetical protein